jgi:hypothetical protein
VWSDSLKIFNLQNMKIAGGGKIQMLGEDGIQELIKN